MANPIRWTEVRVRVASGWQELVAEALTVGPCTSVVMGQADTDQEPPPPGHDFVRTFVPTDTDTADLRARIEEKLVSLAERSGVSELQDLDVRFKPLPPEDYASSWRKTWKPFRVHGLAVIPPWYAGAVREDDRVLRLEPGGAFGSGRHSTTRTCLKVLQRRLEGGERVLDADSGSGILGVSAALLGAAFVRGFDIDENAWRYGTQLARDNGTSQRRVFEHAGFEVLDRCDEPFDAILANIYSDIIQTHATQMREHLAPGGWFVFSGCPAHQVRATHEAIEASGRELQEELTRGRWTTFVGTRGRGRA